MYHYSLFSSLFNCHFRGRENAPPPKEQFPPHLHIHPCWCLHLCCCRLPLLGDFYIVLGFIYVFLFKHVILFMFSFKCPPRGQRRRPPKQQPQRQETQEPQESEMNALYICVKLGPVSVETVVLILFVSNRTCDEWQEALDRENKTKLSQEVSLLSRKPGSRGKLLAWLCSKFKDPPTSSCKIKTFYLVRLVSMQNRK